MSGMMHISVGLGLGLVESCEASTGRSRPLVIGCERWPSWISIVLLSGWTCSSEFEDAELFFITEIGAEAD